MEKRKLQAVGGASFSLTLPKAWVSRNRIKNGDAVEVRMKKNGSLLVKPEMRDKSPLKLKIAIDGLKDEALRREMICSYLSGVDEIRLVGEPISQKQRSLIRDIAKAFVGFEIIESSSARIVLKNILDASMLSVQDSIGKMFLICISIVEDIIRTVSGNNKVLAADIIERDFEVNKLYHMLTRQFNKLMRDMASEELMGIDITRLNYYVQVAGQLERIADHSVKIARTIKQKSEAYNRSAIAAFAKNADQLLSFLRRAQEMVEKRDKQVAYEILDNNAKIEKSIYNDLKISKRLPATFLILRDSIDRFRGYLMNIAEATIDQVAMETADKDI